MIYNIYLNVFMYTVVVCFSNWLKKRLFRRNKLEISHMNLKLLGKTNKK